MEKGKREMPDHSLGREDKNAGRIGTAFVFAAGLGTRLKPWTEHHPKALFPINGKSLLQHNIEYLQLYGIRKVVVNVHHFALQIIDAINSNNGWGSKVLISDETNEVLETGGGLMKAQTLLKNDAPLVLMNVDILTNLNLDDMMAAHFRNKPLATLATTNRATSRYFLFDQDKKLCGWRNTKTGEEKTDKPLKGDEIQKAFSGIHIIDPQLFSLIERQGKFSIVDAYLDLINDHTILSFDHSNSKFIDVGKPESIAVAEAMFRTTI